MSDVGQVTWYLFSLRRGSATHVMLKKLVAGRMLRDDISKSGLSGGSMRHIIRRAINFGLVEADSKWIQITQRGRILLLSKQLELSPISMFVLIRIYWREKNVGMYVRTGEELESVFLPSMTLGKLRWAFEQLARNGWIQRTPERLVYRIPRRRMILLSEYESLFEEVT